MDSNRKIPNLKSSKTALKNNFVEYCKSSSVHGLQYLGEKERPCYEKLFWLIIIFSSLIFCGFMISEVYNRWNTSPVIVNFSEKPTSIWQIPFPAITVCPMTMVNQQIYNYTEALAFLQYLYSIDDNTNLRSNEYFNFSQTEKMTNEKEFITQYVEIYFFNSVDLFEDLAHICNVKPLWFHNMYLEDYGRFVQNLRDVSTNSSATSNCKFLGEVHDCEQLFHEMLTSDGICYTFNGLDNKEVYRVENMNEDFVYYTPQRASQWSLEEGYENENESLYPRRGTTATMLSGLEMTFTSFMSEQDYACEGLYEAYKVYIYEPGETPLSLDQMIFVPLGQIVTISVKPQMMETSEQLQNYSPSRRQCYFNNERYLRFFKIYTQNNCMTECRANYTIQRCNCAFFSLPRPNGTKICGTSIDVMRCVETAKQDYLKPLKENSIAGNCDCLPSCTSLAYDIDLSYSELKIHEYFQVYRNELDLKEARFSRLKVLFKDAQFLTLKRYELYGPIDFLANCGGLLGLFMGFSMLSFVELLYFCSLRLIRKILKANEPSSGEIQTNH